MKNIAVFLPLVYIVTVYADDGWFWHVTDFHYDPTYLDKAISCEQNATERGLFGYSWCDAPWKLVTSSIDAMYDNKADVDFVIWTGDSTPHVKDSVTTHAIYKNIISNITSALKAKFNSTPVYPVFGNHDYYPAHQFPPNNNLMYNEIYENWKDWINNDTQKDSFQKVISWKYFNGYILNFRSAPNHKNKSSTDANLVKFGFVLPFGFLEYVQHPPMPIDVTIGLKPFGIGAYYTVKTQYGIRIMALNTNLYYRSDKISQKYRYSDPAEQFQWMADTLQFAKDNQEKVIMISHVPPGVIASEGEPWFYSQFNHRFNELLLEYSGVISGLYFGHEHIDNFRIYYEGNLPVLVQMCAPSVTPWTYIRPNSEAEPTRNPAVRLVRYDRMSGVPKEITQYYLDLDKSNKHQKASWDIEYTMPKDYGMADLTPISFHHLVERMRTNDSVEFDEYAKRRYVNGANKDVRVSSCRSEACKAPFICSLGNPDVQPFHFCVAPSLPFGRK